MLGLRADGYHELRTVFQTVGLHDRLGIGVDPGSRRADVVLDCDLAGIGGPDNLAVRAARAVLEETGVRRRVRLQLRKQVPMGAGLGGGSSDAAAVLRNLPALLGRRLAFARRLEMAEALGADVPYFLVGGLAVGLGRGSEVYPQADFRPRPVVIVYPGLHVSTADAYRRLDDARRPASPAGAGSPAAAPAPSLTSPAEANKILSFCALLYEGQWDRLENDFEPVVFSASPELARLKRFLLRAGASPALLCGSGSAMFAMYETGAAARRAAARARRQWPRWQVWVTRTVTRRQWLREALEAPE